MRELSGVVVGRVLGGRANLGVDAGDDWRLDLGGMAQALNSRDSQYVYAKDSRSRAAQLAEPHDNDLRHLSARLGTLGPAATLARGYAVVQTGDRVLRSVSDAPAGTALRIRVADGAVTAVSGGKDDD